ncbi:MAG: MFS transporter [Thermodesulfovibrionales bacterium]
MGKNLNRENRDSIVSQRILGFPRNVFFLGLVSLFMDISSEMIHPLIPLFLSETLHVSKTFIGIIEGIAESTASMLKVFSGWFSDRIGRRKPIIFWGYCISVVSRPILATASSWIHVLIYRFTDRIGKGVRTAPRDAIIADSSDRSILGKAFGFHRSMDTIGAVIGPSMAFLLLGIFHNRVQSVFWFSMIPGLFALISIILFVREVRPRCKMEKAVITIRGLDRRFKIFLLISALFTLGKTTEAFLVLRANEIGISIATIPLLYLTFNIVSATLSTPAGLLADRVGKRKTIMTSYIFLSLLFIGFATARTPLHAWSLFVGYGIFVAMNEGIQRAFVATLIRPEIKATGYGIYHTTVGLAALPSGIISGILWQNIGSYALFYFGTVTSFVSFVLFAMFLFKPNKPA